MGSGRTRKGHRWTREAPEGAVRVGFVVEPAEVRSRVLEVLDGVLEEVQGSHSYRDESYFDSDGIYHARGGIHNDRYLRAADGITIQHVDDAVRAFADQGVLIDWNDADAMICQYQRTGEIPDLALMVRLEGGIDAMLQVPRDEQRPAEVDAFESLGVTFVPHLPAGYVARVPGKADQFIVLQPEAWCSCGRDRCIELKALTAHLNAFESIAQRLGDDLDPESEILREAVRLAERFGLGREKAPGAGQHRSDALAAVLLVAEASFGPRFRDDQFVMRLCEILQRPVASSRSMRRYAGEGAVLATLRRMRSVALGALRDFGFPAPPPPDDLDGREIAKSIVALLRTIRRLRGSRRASGEAA